MKNNAKYSDTNTVGIDVSKAKIDVCQLDRDEFSSFENSPKGLQKLVATLPYSSSFKIPVLRDVLRAVVRSSDGGRNGKFQREVS